MRKSKVKAKIAGGGVALGAWPIFHSPELVELSGHMGFDFVFLDGEHCGVDPRDCAELVRAADAVDIDAIVRVPRNEPATILGYLETGVAGVVIPHVRTADEARRAVDAMKYPPDGRRSAMYASRAARYGVSYRIDEYLAEANRETLCIPLLEELEGMRNVRAIGDAPSVDLAFLGEGDLAMDMGFAGDYQHPTVQAVVRETISAARDAGVRFGMSVTRRRARWPPSRPVPRGSSRRRHRSTRVRRGISSTGHAAPHRLARSAPTGAASRAGPGAASAKGFGRARAAGSRGTGARGGSGRARRGRGPPR